MKTLILTHADCDGICAGAVALSRFTDAEVFFTRPVSLYADLSEADANRIIICDIALTRRDANRVIDLLRKKSKTSEILYFDHHPIKNETKRKLSEAVQLYVNEDASTSELIYRYFEKQIPRERVWVAIYGAIGDYEQHTEFIRNRLRRWDMRALYFEASTIVLGIKHPKFDSYDKKREIVYTLSRGKNPSDVPGLVMVSKEVVNDEFHLYEEVKQSVRRIGSVAYVKDPTTFGFRGPSALFASTAANARIGLSVYTRKNHLDLTMRSPDYSLPLNVLCEEAGEAVGGSGGGHVHAAGARIPLNSLERFINELNHLLETKFKR